MPAEIRSSSPAGAELLARGEALRDPRGGRVIGARVVGARAGGKRAIGGIGLDDLKPLHGHRLRCDMPVSWLGA